MWEITDDNSTISTPSKIDLVGFEGHQVFILNSLDFIYNSVYHFLHTGDHFVFNPGRVPTWIELLMSCRQNKADLFCLGAHCIKPTLTAKNMAVWILQS
jgi:hypothetical protein